MYLADSVGAPCASRALDSSVCELQHASSVSDLRIYNRIRPGRTRCIIQNLPGSDSVLIVRTAAVTLYMITFIF